MSGVMVSVLTLNAVDYGYSPGWVKPKTIKLVFAASLLSMLHVTLVEPHVIVKGETDLHKDILFPNPNICISVCYYLCLFFLNKYCLN